MAALSALFQHRATRRAPSRRHLDALAVLGMVAASIAPSQAQNAAAPPPSGTSLGLSLGAGWTSNPAEISTRERGDVAASPQITLGHRWPLWTGAALALNAQAGADYHARQHAENGTRASLSLALSQSWQQLSGTLSLTQRKSMNGDLSRHDTASRELAFALGRPFSLAENWTLAVFGRLARRFYEDGTEDQLRAGVSATLIHKRGPWSFRLGGGFSYTLEDKTPILPRINDRTLSARASVTYEWAKDAEIAFNIGFTRTYSSYPVDRYKAFTFGPQISRTWRF